MKYNAGFIGVGNMGGALFMAACKAENASTLSISDTNAQKCDELSKLTGAVTTDVADLVSNSRLVFLGVKPNIIKTVAQSITNYKKDNTVFVSMAAGVDTKTLCEYLGTDKVIRIMPNTPAAVGEGMLLYCTADGITETDVQMFLYLMSEVGVVDKIDEAHIDAAAALSGCGPAFVYMFADALADGAVKCGLPRDKALLYAKQTIMGSGVMMLESKKHPEQLKDEVCSPGGTTIEGVLALENNNFRHAVSSAVIAAYEKTSKLKK